jgi:hypothetical protein
VRKFVEKPVLSTILSIFIENKKLTQNIVIGCARWRHMTRLL